MTYAFERDPVEWTRCKTAASLSRCLYKLMDFEGRERLDSRLVLHAVETFRKQFDPPLTRTQVIAFIPRRARKNVCHMYLRRRKADPGSVSGLQICPTGELLDHVVVFTVADVELGRTPAPREIVIYGTTPGKRVRHHNIIRRSGEG